MDLLVAAGSDDIPAVGRELNCIDFRLRFFQRIEAEAVAGPPQLHCFIGAGGGEDFSGGMPGEIEDRTVVNIDRAEQPAVSHVPEFDGTVIARRGERCAVGGKLGVKKLIAVAVKGAEHRPTGQIAQLCHACQSCDPSGNHKQPAIGADMHRGHGAGEIGDLGGLLASGVEHRDGATAGHDQPRAIGRKGGGGHRLDTDVGRDRRHGKRRQD